MPEKHFHPRTDRVGTANSEEVAANVQGLNHFQLQFQTNAAGVGIAGATVADLLEGRCHIKLSAK
jgi:hypothetical protein